MSATLPAQTPVSEPTKPRFSGVFLCLPIKTKKRGNKSMAENIYDRVTNAIVASLEKGVGSWARPWTVKAGATSPLPYNIASGANYRGINTVMLWCAREEHGYETQCWGTFDQWKARGASVRKGEKATHVVFFKPTESRVEGADGGEDTIRKGMIARGYCVFNQAQVDGYEAPKVAERLEVERIASWSVACHALYVSHARRR
jgi:antirestriction protein ArdC